MIIELSQEDIAAAAEYAAKVTTIAEGNGPNYTGLSDSNRFFVGKCGEMAVSCWADYYDLKYSDTTNDAGLPDQQDHLFQTKNGPIRTNVKNSHHPKARYMMQPVSQADRHQQDYYIGATGKVVNSRTIQITLWGAISHEDWLRKREQADLHIPTYRILLKDLPLTMQELADIMR